MRLEYDGQSREFKESGGQLYVMFLLAMVVVFLVLAAQFESFLHPFVIMTTVPLAVIGALVGLWMYGMSINVFSQIASIMLVGLAAKNGILIVEFANQLRDRGVEFREAVIEAAAIRLRPVLMTSFCTAFGALPLLLATGAGAESRQAIGVVVFYGVVISVFLTLGRGAGGLRDRRAQHEVAADHLEAAGEAARDRGGSPGRKGRARSRTLSPIRRRSSPRLRQAAGNFCALITD